MTEGTLAVTCSLSSTNTSLKEPQHAVWGGGSQQEMHTLTNKTIDTHKHTEAYTMNLDR